MEILAAIGTWIYNNLIATTSIFMGIVAVIGLAVQHKKGVEIVEAALMTAIGYLIFSAGTSLVCNPIMDINQVLMPLVGASGVSVSSDAETAWAMTLGYVGTSIMPCFALAWALHIVLVKLFPKVCKTVYLTVHMLLNVTALNLLFWSGAMGYTGFAAWFPTIILTALYATFSPLLTYKDAMELSGGTFAQGHLQQIGAWLGGKLAGLVGDPEKDDAENMELPGWLSLFSSTLTNLGISMPITFIVIGLVAVLCGNSAAIDALNTASGNQSWPIWMLVEGLTFAGAVGIIIYGLRLFLGSIVPAFQGFSEKILPGTVPAIDCIAFFSYSPIGVTYAMLAYALAGVVSTLILVAVGAPIIVLPSVMLAFFDGGAVGVFANHKGGWKGCLLAGFVTGLCMHLGGAVLATLLPAEAAAQGLCFGNFDSNTLFTLIFLAYRSLVH